MMACKKALDDADGDLEKAAELVRERTGAKMDARAADRTASEGLVFTYLHTPTPGMPAKVGVLLQLSCETDFVAKADAVQKLAKEPRDAHRCGQAAGGHRGPGRPALLEKEKRVRPQGGARAGQARAHHRADRRRQGQEGLRGLGPAEPALRAGPDKTVAQAISEVQAIVGEKLEVARFARFEVGA
jgi:elongation factor Ts